MKYKNIVLKFGNIFELAKNDFRAKYAGNILGVLWAFIYPCVTVVLYWFVFRVALNSSAGGGVPYILWLVSALVPYLFLCDALPSASSAMIDYSYLVKNVKFNTGTLPLVRVISNFFINIFFVFLLLVISFALGYSPKAADLWLVYYMLAEFVFIWAMSSLLSVLAVFIRDIRGIISVLIQIGYWLTPLFWDISSVAPALGRAVKAVNPITYVTEGFRGTVLYGLSPLDMPQYTLYFWCVTIALGAAARILFKRLKGVLADYV